MLHPLGVGQGERWTKLEMTPPAAPLAATTTASKLYYPFRALGVVTDGLPFVLSRRGDDCFLAVSVDRAYQVLTVNTLGTMHVSRRQIFTTMFRVVVFWQHRRSTHRTTHLQSSRYPGLYGNQRSVWL